MISDSRQKYIKLALRRTHFCSADGRGLGIRMPRRKTILSSALYEVSANQPCNYVARWRTQSRFSLSCAETRINHCSMQLLARMSVCESTCDGTPALSRPRKSCSGSAQVKVMAERFGTYYIGSAASSGSATIMSIRFIARINATN
jgi:hypothetical protein